jgi:hypothetical protein
MSLLCGSQLSVTVTKYLQKSTYTLAQSFRSSSPGSAAFGSVVRKNSVVGAHGRAMLLILRQQGGREGMRGNERERERESKEKDGEKGW